MSVTFVVSAPPHIHSSDDTKKVMRWVIVALLPAALASTLIFGWRSLALIILCAAVSAGTEVLCQLAFRKKITVNDGSAVVSGMLLAFTLPVMTPFWMAAFGAVIATFIVKHLFGGIGFNIFNPALTARAVLLASFPVVMTSWSAPVSRWFSTDAVSAASALGALKEHTADVSYGYVRLLLGTVPGSLGETCKLALLAGFILLLALKIVDWRVPLTFVGTVALLSWLFGRDPLAEILSGGLFLGAFFMATDYVTSPATSTGRFLYGFGCGLLTALIRSYGGFPEGVCYSILFMNGLTPLIDRSVLPRRFGAVKVGNRKEAAK